MTVQAHIDLAELTGAELHFGEPVLDWSETSGGAVTDHRTAQLHRRAVGDLPGRLGAPAARRVRHSHHDRTPGAGLVGPRRWNGALRRPPIFIDEDATTGMQAYGFPAIDGPRGGVKVGFYRNGIVCSPETIDRTVHDQEIAEMREGVAHVVPALDGPCLHSATCMYSNTPDQNFVIARHPDSENITVACGFSGHGFKFVPIVGEILADLAIDGVTGHPSRCSTRSDW